MMSENEYANRLNEMQSNAAKTAEKIRLAVLSKFFKPRLTLVPKK